MRPHPRKPVIGLIGGIGSGKSAVADEFARRGAHIITGDTLGHEALRDPTVVATLTQRWGRRVCTPSGDLNRKTIAAVVFADPAERRFLESVVFPYIENRIREEIARAVADPLVQWIVLDAAVMLESGWDRHCDLVVYVHAPRPQRLARLTAGRTWTEDDLRQRSAAQLPLTVKVTRADQVIDNSGPLNRLAPQVDRVLASPELYTSEACSNR